MYIFVLSILPTSDEHCRAPRAPLCLPGGHFAYDPLTIRLASKVVRGLLFVPMMIYFLLLMW